MKTWRAPAANGNYVIPSPILPSSSERRRRKQTRPWAARHQLTLKRAMRERRGSGDRAHEAPPSSGHPASEVDWGAFPRGLYVRSERRHRESGAHAISENRIIKLVREQPGSARRRRS